MIGVKRALVVLTVLFSLLMPATSYAAGKVTPNPASLTLTEGQSQTITVSLDEPIIGPGPDSPTVDIPVVPSDTSRLTSSAASISWQASEWFQVRTFTITATDDSLDNGDVNLTVPLLVTSQSEYYNHYLTTVHVTVLDNDDTPVVAASQTTVAPPPAAQLAETGSGSQVLLAEFVGWSLVIVSLGLWKFGSTNRTNKRKIC